MPIYIVSALRSALEQDFGGTYEIIIVDDHGTDGSMALVAELQRTHPRGNLIRVIRPEHNVGQGKGREMALHAAQGRFCYMMDADDLLLPHTLSHLYGLQEQYDVDFVKGSYAWGQEASSRMVFEDAVLCDNMAIQSYNALHPGKTVWNVLYKTDFLRTCEFVLENRKMIGVEDFYLSLQVVAKAGRAVYSSQVTYLYRLNMFSVSSQKVWKEKGLIDDALCLHEKYLRPLAWSPSGKAGKKLQGFRVKRAAWEAITTSGILMVIKEGHLDEEARGYLKRLLVFPIPGNFLQVVGRILRLDNYRLKIGALYGIYCLPLGLKARYVYRFARGKQAFVATTGGNMSDWETMMKAVYANV